MAVRTIRLLGDPVLRARSHEVLAFDRSLRKLLRSLEDTMRDAGGVGLAAPQIGVPLRVFTYRLNDRDGTLREGHVVNPVLLPVDEEEQYGPEGCLSVPDLVLPVRRRLRVVVEGLDISGEPVRVQGTELLARCLQHETDHLDGILFLDHLEPGLRERALAELRERGESPVVKRSPHPPHAL